MYAPQPTQARYLPYNPYFSTESGSATSQDLYGHVSDSRQILQPRRASNPIPSPSPTSSHVNNIPEHDQILQVSSWSCEYSLSNFEKAGSREEPWSSANQRNPGQSEYPVEAREGPRQTNGTDDLGIMSETCNSQNFLYNEQRPSLPDFADVNMTPSLPHHPAPITGHTLMTSEIPSISTSDHKTSDDVGAPRDEGYGLTEFSYGVVNMDLDMDRGGSSWQSNSNTE